jgi:hypothetical protein
MLDEDGYGARARLARKLGVSRARVTQVLSLLNLEPSVLELIIKLGNPLQSKTVSERKLRSIIHLSSHEQLELVNDWLFK